MDFQTNTASTVMTNRK